MLKINYVYRHLKEHNPSKRLGGYLWMRGVLLNNFVKSCHNQEIITYYQFTCSKQVIITTTNFIQSHIQSIQFKF